MEPLNRLQITYWHLGVETFDELDSERKHKLASIINISIPLYSQGEYMGSSPFSLAAVRICRSFAKFCLGENREIIIPELPSPIELGVVFE